MAEAANLPVVVTVPTTGIKERTNFVVPKWLAVLMLNFTGVYDELIIVFLFVKWVGPSDVYYSALHSYKMWLEPKVGVYVDQLRAAAAPYLSQITSKAKAKAE